MNVAERPHRSRTCSTAVQASVGCAGGRTGPHKGHSVNQAREKAVKHSYRHGFTRIQSSADDLEALALFGLDDAAAGAERADRRLDARRPFDAVQPLGIEQPQHPHVAQILFEGLQ